MKSFGKFIGVVCTLTVIVFAVGWYLGAVEISIDLSRIQLESSNTKTQQAKVLTVKEKANKAEEEKATIVKEDNTSTREEAERAFADLDKRIWTSVKNRDQKTFESIFENLDDADKQIMLGAYPDWEKEAPSLTKTYTHIMAEANGYYLAEAIHYLTSNNGKEHHESDRTYTIYIQKTNGKWILVSPDDDTRTVLTKKVHSLCPEEFQDAVNNNRNCMFFGNFYWLDSRGVFENVVTSNAIYAWQNKDGSVDVAVSIANGENTIHKVTKCTVTLKDEKLGQILKVTESISLQVLPGTREIYTFHVKPGKIRKGTWTTMTSSTHIDY